MTQEKSSSWTFTPRNAAKNEKEEPDVLELARIVPRKPKTEEKVPPPEARPVLPRGSMMKENLTQLAVTGCD